MRDNSDEALLVSTVTVYLIKTLCCRVFVFTVSCFLCSFTGAKTPGGTKI
jgi:hypothetical protein